MVKIITDKNKIEEILTRGVENIYPDRKILEKELLSGRKLKIYCGFDPSAPSLHIGNAIQIKKLAEFQSLGHEVIFLIGDFTGMIGDPTDKAVARKKMTHQEILDNSKNFKKQASAYLSFSGTNAAKIIHNSKWLDKLNFKDLIELSSNFTVQQMLNRGMFKERMLGGKANTYVKCRHCGFVWPSPIQFGSRKSFDTAKVYNNKTGCPNCGKITTIDKEDLIQSEPIYLHEFLYPLAQGYDSVAMDIDVEIGGNDQMFNMMVGRDLMKLVKGKEKFVLTTKLLVDPNGKKMGKTEGSIVNLDTDPNNMYGQIMSWPDSLIGIGFELCTNMPFNEVKKIQHQLKIQSFNPEDLKKHDWPPDIIKTVNKISKIVKKSSKEPNVNPRDLKMKLAFEITKINHGEKKAKEAQEYFVKTVQKKEVPDKIKEIKMAQSDTTNKWKLHDLLTAFETVNSISEARRLIKQGGVKVDGDVVKDVMHVIYVTKEGVIIQKGKREFVKFILE